MLFIARPFIPNDSRIRYHTIKSTTSRNTCDMSHVEVWLNFRLRQKGNFIGTKLKEIFSVTKTKSWYIYKEQKHI